MSVLIDRGFLHVLLLATAVPAFAQQTTWKDSSPHRVELVAVDGGVQLEVLDWRGSGPALVLLAGLGDTAHVFDDFAQALIPRHRVVGVTRRGFGRSSPSPSGYGFARLAEDVARVIATLGLDRPLVIGHSFAGEEMHLLGARHSAAISGLVYVDAAFNRADDFDEDDEVERTLPPPPAPGPADLASFGRLVGSLALRAGAIRTAFVRALRQAAPLPSAFVGRYDPTKAGDPWAELAAVTSPVVRSARIPAASDGKRLADQAADLARAAARRHARHIRSLRASRENPSAFAGIYDPATAPVVTGDWSSICRFWPDQPATAPSRAKAVANERT